VEISPVDVNLSAARCVVELGMVRISLDYVAFGRERRGGALVDERDAGAFVDFADLARRAQLSLDGLEALVSSGACERLRMPARNLLWSSGSSFGRNRSREREERQSSSPSLSGRRRDA